QTLVRDLLAGFLLIMEGQYDIGDTVVVSDTVGTIEDLTLRVTRLRSIDGSTVFVANGEIRKLSNRSRGWAQVAVDTAVPAATDVDTLLEATAAAAQSVSSDPDLAGALVVAPKVEGIVAADAATITARVSVRADHARRDEVERALRVEIARHLRSGGVFAGAGTDAAATP
ncbi:MAG TPA: mechanosensitive ion channel domain-containing protein, partial [Acidimicrobiales bacterium]|nr:mechanosensitive ion channel domain-containing protein [Acidimicrobiales bacterium]